MSYLLQSSKPEDDGSFVLRYDTNAEEDGNWEGEDDKEDGDGFQQERTAIKALLRAIIVIHRHNLEIKAINIWRWRKNVKCCLPRPWMTFSLGFIFLFVVWQ